LRLDPFRADRRGRDLIDNDEFAKEKREGLHRGAVYDANIQPEVRIADIEGIPLVATEDLIEALSGATVPFNLGEAGDPGFHQVAKFIGVHNFGEVRAILVHMGSGADDAHMAGQDIQELGYLIQVRIAQEAAHPGNPRVVIGGLFGIRLVIHIHGPELQARKGASEEADAPLHKENGASRVQLDENIKEGKEPAEDENQGDKGHGNVENPFGKQITLPLGYILSQVDRVFFANVLFQFGFSDTWCFNHRIQGLMNLDPFYQFNSGCKTNTLTHLIRSDPAFSLMFNRRIDFSIK